MARRQTAWLAALLLGASGAGASAADAPFTQPVKDCRPCRFSPGPGQPSFDLTFVFEGAGDQRKLVALEVAPAGGGTAQRLPVGDLADAQSDDGFQLSLVDLRGDGNGALGLLTSVSADSQPTAYWLYEPATRRFVALERAPDDTNCPLTRVPATGELHCGIALGPVASVETWYRLDGNRAVALRTVELGADEAFMVRTTTDLTVKPPHVVTARVGFAGESPQRAAFRRLLDISAAQAATHYNQGDKAGAVGALETVLKPMDPRALTDAVPADPSDKDDMHIVRELNDYGFYLEEAGRPADALAILDAVIELDPNRTVAYLNRADARFAAGRADAAKDDYAAYTTRMTADGKAARIPPRVAERMR